MRPIAMKCTQEEFDSIKEKLSNITDIDSFDRDSYLVNNYCYDQITNLNGNCKTAHDRTCYETFNANIFLEACDIEVEKVWKGSEIQIDFGWGWINASEKNNYRIKPQPNYQKEIEALQQKAKENGMKVIINFEKI